MSDVPAAQSAHHEPAPQVGNTKGAFNTSGVVCQTHVGGQALIEGVMMRGRSSWAVAVREPDGGIYTEQHDLASGASKNRWMHVPVIRGVTAFAESLVLGYKALSIAGEHAYDFSEEDDAGDKGDGALSASGTHAAALMVLHALSVPFQAALDVEPPATSEPQAPRAASEPQPQPQPAGQPAEKGADEGMPKGLMTLSMVIGCVLGVVLFVVAPAFVTNLIVGDYLRGALTWNLVDGALRVAIFLAYLALIALMPDIKRMFAYHGAEHKTIHCYEHGQELTPANAMRFPRLHVRCGTAFLLMTMVIAIFVFTVVPVDRLIAAWGVTNSAAMLILVIVSRIILLPLVAGLAYEVTVKWAGSHPENRAVQVVLWPGLQLQRLTTNIPDEGMLECAISAMEQVLVREGLPLKAA